MKSREEDRSEEVLPTCGLCYKDLNEHDFLKVQFMVQKLLLRRLRHFVLETLNCEVWK
jgi:hypothetical protein